MIYIRKSNDRGFASHDWLKSWHTFSFANYYDEKFMGFSALRVINEDIIDADAGFPPHPHQDMEILTYILKGTVEHKDSMGNKDQIHTGEFQIMSAGTGVRHSEYNANIDKPLHLYQIWITPKTKNITPRYEQKIFAAKEGKQLILSPDEREGSLKIYQDMQLWRWVFKEGQSTSSTIIGNRKVWIQVVQGELKINNKSVKTSDGVAIWAEDQYTVKAETDSEILLFDLPPI